MSRIALNLYEPFAFAFSTIANWKCQTGNSDSMDQSVTIHWKAVEQYFPLMLFVCSRLGVAFSLYRFIHCAMSSFWSYKADAKL